MKSKKIIANIITWFAFTLLPISLFALFMDLITIFSGLDLFLEFSPLIAYSFVGALIQSLFIYRNNFGLGILSILIIGASTAFIVSSGISILAIGIYDMNFLQDILTPTYWSLLPCCFVALISYAIGFYKYKS